MAYRTVLLDLDHTLLDSDASELAAFAATMASVGIADPAVHFDRYTRINRTLWQAVEQGRIGPLDVRLARFEQFCVELSIDANPHAMGDTFAWALGANGDLYPGAREMLDTIAGSASLALVTNGLSEVQRARIERLDLAAYFDAVVISAEVGVSKPAGGIFDLTFAALGHPPLDSALMVGDSLTSDIRGGADYGIDTCWYNPHANDAGPGAGVVHEIRSLAELPSVIADGAVRSPAPA